MRTHRRFGGGLIFVLGFVVLPALLQAKGSDGLVMLRGTVEDVRAQSDELSLAFTGKLSFTFYTASFDDPDRETVELAFNVKKLPVHVPKFGSGEYDPEGCRYRVTYRNAMENASEAARLGETVHIAIFKPKLVYGPGGVLEMVEAAHAQVLSESRLREARDHGFPAECSVR